VTLIPILASIPGFGFANILLALGVGITNTAVPGFISLMTPPERQGSTLGITQSIGSIARVFGPIMGGVVTEFSNVQSSFYLSGALLVITFLLGCRLFQACTLRGLLEPLDSRSRDELESLPQY
jgi:MFS family permease